jgi:hypothetical protein
MWELNLDGQDVLINSRLVRLVLFVIHKGMVLIVQRALRIYLTPGGFPRTRLNRFKILA